MHANYPSPPPSRIRGPKKPKAEPLNPGMEGPLKFLSTAFGASYLLPPAPGTAGMVVGFGLWWVLGKLGLNPFFHFCILFAFVGAGVWITGKAEPYWGSADESIMSFDCMVGFMIAAAPFRPNFHPGWTSMLGVIFAVYWLLNVIQPFPISKARELPGGLGQMGDDVAAGVVALLITWGGYHAIWRDLLGLTTVVKPGGL